MCIQYLCFICDRPLTGYQYFLRCHSNPQAKPPWLEEWKSTSQCTRPIYCYSSVCHIPCNETRLHTRAEIERQLGIEAVIGRSDGLWDWHRSQHAVQSAPQLTIPQVKVLLLPQWPQNVQASKHEHAHDTMIIPTQAIQKQQALPRLHTQGLITFLRTEKESSPQGYVTAQIRQGPWAESPPSPSDRGPQTSNESNLSIPSSRVSTPSGLPSHVTGSGAITKERHSKTRKSHPARRRRGRDKLQWQLDPIAYTGFQDIPPTSAVVQNNSSMLPALPVVPLMSSVTPGILPMPATGPRVPVMSVAPSSPHPPKQITYRACDRCRYMHLKCNRSLPSCSRCTIRMVPCTHAIATTRTTPPNLNNPRGKLMDFRDTGMEMGAYERLPSVSMFMSAGRTSMDYPLDGSDPMENPYGRSRTLTMGGHMSNGSSQTSPFVTPPTPMPSIQAHGPSMEPANDGGDVLEAFGLRDQPTTTFGGNLGGAAAEGRASTALDQRFQDIRWEHEQQEQIFHQSCESQ